MVSGRTNPAIVNSPTTMQRNQAPRAVFPVAVFIPMPPMESFKVLSESPKIYANPMAEPPLLRNSAAWHDHRYIKNSWTVDHDSHRRKVRDLAQGQSIESRSHDRKI